jgi:hypothetical protein
VFEGEGEARHGMLCSGRDFSEIPGLIYRGTSDIFRNRKTDTMSLNKLALPDFTDLNLFHYFNPEPVFPAVFSRGCKWWPLYRIEISKDDSVNVRMDR